MRELTRSMMRFSWAMPLLGMNQMVSLVSSGSQGRPCEAATETLDRLAETASRQLGSGLRDVYQQGDRIQGRLVDAMTGVLSRAGGGTSGCGCGCGSGRGGGGQTAGKCSCGDRP